MDVQHGKAYKQKGRPICGIYAFLNGILHDNNQKKKLQKCDVDKIANQIWSMALGSSSLNNMDKYNDIFDKDDIFDEYSLVGEFYDSCTLVNFFTQNKTKIENLFKKYGLNISYNVTDELTPNNVTANDLELDNKEENCFYLIPINSGKKSGKGKNNMHWICYEKCGEDLVIFNSGDGCAEKRAKKNSGLCKFASFCRIISKTSDLYEVWKNMYDREDDYRRKHKRCNNSLELHFDFYKWKPNKLIKFLAKHFKEYPKIYWKRIDRINEGCEYSFEKSNFNIVKVIIK